MKHLYRKSILHLFNLLTKIKKMKKTKILLGLLIAYALNGCSLLGETEPDLPPATQTGANTIGFKVNGKNWVPKDEAKFVTRPKANGGGGRLSILNTMEIGGAQISTDDRIKSYFFIDLYDFTYSKTYSIISMNLDNKWGIAKGKPWKLEISKYDTTERIIAGTFSFLGTAQDGSTVNITDGRFDIKYVKE